MKIDQQTKINQVGYEEVDAFYESDESNFVAPAEFMPAIQVNKISQWIDSRYGFNVETTVDFSYLACRTYTENDTRLAVRKKAVGHYEIEVLTNPADCRGIPRYQKMGVKTKEITEKLRQVQVRNPTMVEYAGGVHADPMPFPRNPRLGK